MEEQFGAFGAAVHSSASKAYKSRAALYTCWSNLDGLVAAVHAGRHRWVVYGNMNWPQGQDPTTVDDSWHCAYTLQNWETCCSAYTEGW